MSGSGLKNEFVTVLRLSLSLFLSPDPDMVDFIQIWTLYHLGGTNTNLYMYSMPKLVAYKSVYKVCNLSLIHI